MNQKELQDKCYAIIAELFKVPPESLNGDSSPDSLPEWDSLAHVQLVMALEKEFQVEIPPDESINFENLKMICDYLESQLL
jgi:acyl carrier protein